MRHFTLALLLALVAGIVALPAYAQEPTFGLSDEDFALITNANTALTESTAFSFDVTFNMLVEAQGQDIDINFSANGGVSELGSPDGAAQLVVSGNAVNGAETLPIEAEIRIVDGNFYVNATNPETGEPTGWQGTALENATGAFSEGFERGSGGMNLDSLTSDPQTAPIFNLLSSLDPEAFISVERVGNETIDGVDTVHFVGNFSIVDLLQTEQINALISQQMSGGAELTAQQQQMITQMFATLFENAVIRLEQYISPDDVMVRRTVLTIDLNIDPASIGANNATGNIILQLSLDAAFSGFGEALSVEVPADATMSTGSALPNLTGGEGITNLGNLGGETAEATDISAGAPVTVDYTGDPVTFNYVSNGDETITVTARSVVAGGIDTTLEVSNADFSVFAYNDDHGTGSSDLGRFDSQVVVGLPTADTYTITLGSFSFASGQVEVTVTSEAGVTASSSSSSSNSVSLGSTYAISHGGTIAYGDVVEDLVQDNAIYQLEFEGNSDDIISIAARRADSGFDPVLTLYLNGTEVARNDDHGTNDTSFGSFDSLINNFRLPETGTYIIEVRGFAYSGGNFELTLSN